MSMSDMEDGDLLSHCRDDGMKWSEAFCATAKKLGYSDMDQDWVFGWFANAIENTEIYRREKIQAHAFEQAEQEARAVRDNYSQDSQPWNVASNILGGILRRKDWLSLSKPRINQKEE